jgi:hypothetical protein
MSKTEALVTRGPVTLATDAGVPEYLKELIGNQAGLEDVDQSDLIIPRLAVAQGTTPELKKSSENYIKDLKVGDLFNSLTGEVYGESVTVLPLFFYRNYIKFRKNADGSPAGVERIYKDRSEVPDHELEFQGDAKPVTTAFRNIMAMLIQEGRKPEPICVSFKPGSKLGKKWVSIMKGLNLPCYVRTYTLTVMELSNAKGTWNEPKATEGEWVPKALVAQAKSYFESLQEAGVKVDTTGMSMDDVEDREPGSDDDAPRY